MYQKKQNQLINKIKNKQKISELIKHKQNRLCVVSQK